MNGNKLVFLPKKSYHQLFNITFSAMMLALAIITSLISEFISIPFFSQLKLTFDISVVFLVACAFFVSLGWSLTITLASALTSFFWNTNNVIGVLTATLANLSTILFTRLYFCLFSKRRFCWIFVFLFTTLSNALLLTTLNGILITPLFWYYFGYVQTPNFLIVAEQYNKNTDFHFFFFGINNYWLGIFCLYSFFNLVKFGLVSCFGVPIMRSFQKFYWKRALAK